MLSLLTRTPISRRIAVLSRHFSACATTMTQVFPIPVRSDNYAYLILDKNKKAAVVDPYDVSKVLAKIQELGVKEENVESVLTTHHHYDHSGGNEEFTKKLPHVKVYGGSTQIPALTNQVKDGDSFTIGDDIEVKALATPCHTQDSICFHITSPSDQAGGVFTGDTLFIAGCGRFFEGTPEQMTASLSYLSTALPPSTIVYNGHEYTAGNLAFAKSVLGDEHPELKRLANLLNEEDGVIGRTTIEDEKKWNVFLPSLFKEDAIRKATGKTDENEIMGTLRELKNNFRG